uniref:NADH-ubiquinone oxidoreductase chain 1 n=1 Tax=Metacrangonyx spinicaudatus TaxID=1199190 RepID=K7ZVZ5_9CRUS|nr:NADH dehydrogenase subunit 1 [Metacrangonyx spinicaudatus]CCI69431.1 NADH dehydrogenase subunit 1 [Metacrangonyx spinicaudatus]
MVLEYLILIINYVIMFILVMITVAFMTLLEQKVVGSMQIRVGPNKTGIWGVLQPFADAVKLFLKENLNLQMSNMMMYFVTPSLSLMFSLSLWIVYPFSQGGIDFFLGVLFFMCLSSMGVYPIMLMGWSSNCKYSMMGCMRAMAQMISYEVSLMMIILSLIYIKSSFNFSELMNWSLLLLPLVIFLPLGLIWMASSLAETNRTPYDFSESGSELVSGFNTEYSGGGFTLIFLAEYSSILFMSMLFVLFFLSYKTISLFSFIMTMMIAFLFIWVRSTMPRFRYDKLMGLAWKIFLPVSLFLFLYYLSYN